MLLFRKFLGDFIGHKNIGQLRTMDSSLIESIERTVTWKYTIVGWPAIFGARFLS